MLVLYDEGGHKVVLYSGLAPRGLVQANQLIIVDGDEALIADPGGRTVFNKLFSELNRHIPATKIRYIFYSHQDPDVAGAAASWRLAALQAKVLISEIWVRFIPHMFTSSVADDFYLPVPDEGMEVELGSSKLRLVPTHFLHSPGAFSLYDPVSKVLFSGDVGASIMPEDAGYETVDTPEAFEEHKQYMEWFHTRIMASQKACRRWAALVRELGAETIVPQHGAALRGRDTVDAFLEWLEKLECGVDKLY